MKNATLAKQKSGRRRVTGFAPLMGFRADTVLRASIVKWAEEQPDMPTLSEATRRLVELGLTVKTRARSSGNSQRRLRAQELAANVIDEIGDPTALHEERTQRRRRLTRGPEEFQEVRVDRPKSKGTNR